MGHPKGQSDITLLGDVRGPIFHVGDEAMLDANLALLHREAPAATVTVLGRNADRNAIAAALDDADAALIAGGGSLGDGWPALCDQRLTLIEDAARRSIPVATGGQTLGPAITGERRDRLTRALASAALIGTREVRSTALALELGVAPERIVYQVDDAFTMTGKPPDDQELLARVEGPYMAVTLDASYGTEQAAGGLRGLVSQLAALAAELHLTIVFVPHYGELGERQGPDPEVGHRLGRLLQLAGATYHLARVQPVAETIWLTHRAALTVSSRYHPLVFASAAARPCVGLYRDDYTHAKLHGALAHVGAERWCLPTGAAEGGGLAKAVRALWADRGAESERMAQARPAIEARETARQARILQELGLKDPPHDPAKERETSVLGWPAPNLALATIRLVGTNSQAAEQRDAQQAPGAGNEQLTAAGRRPAETSTVLTDEQWDGFARDGFLHLGQVLEPHEIDRLTQHADDLAMGRVHNEHVQMQIDTGGAYEELPDAVDSFDEGTHLYRKIQGLEMDDQFIPLIRHPRFFEACARIYGPHVPLSIFRAMVMNKPAGQGTILPWHQDGGDVWGLDREPLVTIWVALDPATTANGCMEAVRGSHRLGLLSDFGSTLSDEDAALHCPPERVVPLEVPAGHAVLMHNWLIHRSGVNPSPVPRRAVTICYLDGRTRSIHTGNHFAVVAGNVGTAPHPYVRQYEIDTKSLRTSFVTCEEYARSLEGALEAARASQQELEGYAKSLEAERARLEAELAVASSEPAAPAARVHGGLRARLRARR
jgi:ectoine hydroxylase-related dioxygenase (phytanoyl-CoA dioxygenase family)/polysaccharide pyruvyl transferase WcaK-like protein